MPMQTAASVSRAIAAGGGTSGISTSSSGAGSTSSPNQQHDAVLRAFAALLSSAVATADDSRSLEHDITNNTRDLCAARSAGLPLLFSSEVLAVAHAQLRVAQEAAAAARKTKNSSGGGGLNIRNVGGGSSEGEDGDDDSNIWWLASAPSLDLRNKSKPLSSLLSRSLRMSPAVSAAFNLSLPVRAVCGRAEDLVGGGDRTTSTSTVQAGSVLTNKTSLTILPRRLLQNVAASYKSLVDSRLRSSLSALLKRTLSSSGGSGIGGIGVHSSGAAGAALLRSQTVGLVSLMSQSDAVVVTAAASSFRVVDVPGGSTDEGLDSTGHLYGRTVPLIFEVVLDVIVHEVKTTAILQAPGSLTGQFVARRMSASSRSGSSSSQGEQGKQKQEENRKEEEEEEEEPRLARVELTVDAPHLLQMMMEEARKAVREAVSACATNITAATTATTNIAEQKQQQQQHHPAQPQQQQQNLPRKVSDTLLRPGLKRKAPTSSSLPSLTSKSKIILPKPKRRSSAFSSTGSIIDEEGLAGSSSGQQLSGGSDTFMPPPRPRSPLSKSRSSSRLLFYSGGRKSSTQDGLSATSAATIAGDNPGRIATSKSANQNASWEEASYSSSASRSSSSSTGSSGSGSANATNTNGAAGSAAAPSSANASAATAAGFALLSMKKKSPKAKTSSQGKTGTDMSSGGIKRSRSDQNTPLKKRIVSRDG